MTMGRGTGSQVHPVSGVTQEWTIVDELDHEPAACVKTMCENWILSPVVNLRILNMNYHVSCIFLIHTVLPRASYSVNVTYCDWIFQCP